MACRSCRNQPTQPVQNIIAEPQECVYTFEQITAKYLELKEAGANDFNLAILKSALNFYATDCNRFNGHLSLIL